MTMVTADSIVVGGGIIGLLTARRLSELGSSVILLEKGKIGQESSWAGGGILSSLSPWTEDPAITQLIQDSQIQYPNILESLASEAGLPLEWARSGLLFLSLSASEWAEALQWGKTCGKRIEKMTSLELQRLSLGRKMLDSDVGLFLPDVMQLRPPRLLKALHVALSKKPKIRIFEQEPAIGLSIEKGRCLGVVTSKNIFSANTVVITAGAWSAGLLSSIGVGLSIFPVRGQMLLFKCDSKLLNPILVERGTYLIPRADGMVLVGSTIESVGFDKSVTQVAYHYLSSCAYQIAPVLQHAAQLVAQWSGLRPGHAKNIPFIGRASSHIEGLFVGAGHFRHGLAMAPATADRLAADILA